MFIQHPSSTGMFPAMNRIGRTHEKYILALSLFSRVTKSTEVILLLIVKIHSYSVGGYSHNRESGFRCKDYLESVLESQQTEVHYYL